MEDGHSDYDSSEDYYSYLKAKWKCTKFDLIMFLILHILFTDSV